MREHPEDPEHLTRREAFCARGQQENDVYLDVVKTWKASGVMQAPRVLRSVVVFCLALIGATYFAYDPVRVALLADMSTGVDPVERTLSSGDIAVLDADSALADRTKPDARRIELLEGAAFFDVEKDSRPFSVLAGDVTVSVVGTAFETAFADDSVVVGVIEGRVDVQRNGKTWSLVAGDQFEWSPKSGANVKARDPEAIAAWRTDRLVVDGMTLGQAAAIIERRLPGPVFFSSATLRDARVTGSLDLSNPLSALRILAETGGGMVLNAGRAGRIITWR